jgi:quercetin dioxygenase-like cupin family protein
VIGFYKDQTDNYIQTNYQMLYTHIFSPKWNMNLTLHYTDGEGYYQERGKKAQLIKPGDIVEIPANVEHWHGATKDSKFIHIGITPKSSKNKAEWLEQVNDEEYTKL